MKDSLCAHCAHTDQVAYSGFFCDETGYCENKTVAEGCEAFEPDAIDGMTRMITEKLLAAYPNSADFGVNKAEILRLCNEIEDVLEELCKIRELPLYYYSEIMKRLKAIGKELNRDAESKTD